MLLKDKVAVITGTSSGIGLATAALFAEHGADIVCIDEKPNPETIARVEAAGRSALLLRADIADPAQVRAAAAACERKHAHVHVLFNNAGRIARQIFEETTDDAWADMVGVNLSGSFYCAREFLPLLKRAGGASIIHHASIDAILGNPNLAAYSAAKGGLIPLTHVMAHNLGRYNIRVNCLSSGGIDTAMRSEFSSRIAVTPLQRIGTPGEVAHAALFLASDWSSFITGANLVVDGGRTAITPGTYHG